LKTEPIQKPTPEKILFFCGGGNEDTGFFHLVIGRLHLNEPPTQRPLPCYLSLSLSHTHTHTHTHILCSNVVVTMVS
jgi:hypothetical protein